MKLAIEEREKDLEIEKHMSEYLIIVSVHISRQKVDSEINETEVAGNVCKRKNM